jgi:hypothetical protein
MTITEIIMILEQIRFEMGDIETNIDEVEHQYIHNKLIFHEK